MANIDEDKKKNFEKIRRIDTSAVKVIEYYDQASVFSFVDGQWKKTDIQNVPLFLYEKVVGARYALLVGLPPEESFTLEITQEIQVQHDPSNNIFIKNVEQGILRVRGVGISDKDCCKQVFDAIVQLLNEQRSSQCTMVKIHNSSSDIDATEEQSIDDVQQRPRNDSVAGNNVTGVVNDSFESEENTDLLDELDFYEPSLERKVRGPAIVVRKRPKYVLMYNREFGLCILLQRYADVQSDAEFDEKFVLAQFYDVSFVPPMEQKVIGRLSYEWMCFGDAAKLSKERMPSRVIFGGFVQIFISCSFFDESMTKLGGERWIVDTDLGNVLFEEKTFPEKNAFFGKTVDLWVTFVKEYEGCHWQILMDSYENNATVTNSNCMANVVESSMVGCDDMSMTTSTTVSSPTMVKQVMEEEEQDEDELLRSLEEASSTTNEQSSPQSSGSIFFAAGDRSPKTTPPYQQQLMSQHMLRPVSYGDLERQTETILGRMREEMTLMVEQLREEMAEGFREMLKMGRGGNNNNHRNH
uniref:Tudor domain-containing protein n=1 Tax=Globodera pallida TaxID=36090 RepID=A0A183BJ39_GLOPA